MMCSRMDKSIQSFLSSPPEQLLVAESEKSQCQEIFWSSWVFNEYFSPGKEKHREQSLAPKRNTFFFFFLTVKIEQAIFLKQKEDLKRCYIPEDILSLLEKKCKAWWWWNRHVCSDPNGGETSTAMSSHGARISLWKNWEPEGMDCRRGSCLSC